MSHTGTIGDGLSITGEDQSINGEESSHTGEELGSGGEGEDAIAGEVVARPGRARPDPRRW